MPEHCQRDISPQACQGSAGSDEVTTDPEAGLFPLGVEDGAAAARAALALRSLDGRLQVGGWTVGHVSGPAARENPASPNGAQVHRLGSGLTRH